jgi:hypothetical protein
LSAYAEYVGYNGTGTFTQIGGANTISETLYLGKSSGSSGTYNLSSTGILKGARYVFIGYYGTGTFTQTGGSNTISSDLYLGYNAGSGGTYYLSDTHTVGNISGGGTTKVDAGASLIVKSISQGALTIGAGGMLTIRPTVYSWNGGGADNLWTNNDNWDVDMAPTISDNIILSAGAAKLLNFNDFAPDIEFDSLTVSASGYNIQGNALHSAKVTVLPGVSFQCKGIYTSTLTIGSGATVTIEAISGGPQGGEITPVPEPGAWILLATACLAMLAYRRAIGCRL